MSSVSVRDLRNHGGDVLARVQRGEAVTVTSSGRPVARLVPLPKTPPSPDEIVDRWRRLPPISADKLRADLDAVLDAHL